MMMMVMMMMFGSWTIVSIEGSGAGRTLLMLFRCTRTRLVDELIANRRGGGGYGAGGTRRRCRGDCHCHRRLIGGWI